jgi:ketosteroid isomerase-like protein
MGHPNEDLTRKGYEAFGKGDMQTVSDLFADDIVWHVPGRSSLSGDYKGKDQVFGLFARLVELTGGTFRLELHDVLANDDHAVVLAESHAEREGRVLNDRGVNVLHLSDGKVTEFWGHAGDTYAVDEFWG